MRMPATLALALTFAGCRGPCDGAVDCGGIEATHAYVIRVLEVPAIAGDPAAAVGDDLDGITSAGGPACTDADDFVSPISGRGGVDNQLAVFAPTFADDFANGDLNQELAARITSGELLLVLEVTSSGIVSDANVTVHAFLATPRDDLVVVDGLLVPGQQFDVGTDLGVGTGRIAPTPERSLPGRLDVVLPALPLSVVAGDLGLVLTLRNVHLSADISEDALGNGELGGSIALSDLEPLNALLGCAGVCPMEPTIEDVAHPDLSPDGAGACTAVSAGLRFEAIAAAPPP